MEPKGYELLKIETKIDGLEKELSRLFADFKKYELKKEVISEYANWPTTYDWEEISIKKYEADSEQGQTPHSDQFNIASAKRFLIFFGYLSDCDQGETEFPELNITIPPTKGSILLFPPFWTHIHKGCPPVRNHKYIIKSSLMYIN